MDEEKLINNVQLYKCLYDVTSPQYCDKLMKMNAWEAISSEMNAPVAECKKFWKKLRDNYRKSLNARKERSGAAAGKRRQIKFEKELEFIKPFIKQEEDQQMTSLDSSSEDTQSSGIICPETPRPQSQTSNHSQLKTSQILERYLSIKEMDSEKEKHPIDMFFSSMAATVKKLSTKTQAQIKRDVLNVITDAEIREYDEQTKRSTDQDNQEDIYVPSKIHRHSRYVEDDTFMCIPPRDRSPTTNQQYYQKNYTTGNPLSDAPTHNLPIRSRVQTQTTGNVIETVAEIYEYNSQNNQQQGFMPNYTTGDPRPASTCQNNQQQRFMPNYTTGDPRPASTCQNNQQQRFMPNYTTGDPRPDDVAMYHPPTTKYN